jgi:energy-coupling factor transport system permease protein
VIHTYAWLGWLMAVLVSLSATRNPLYLILILLCLAIVYLHISRFRGSSSVPISPWRFSLVVVTLTTLFNALTSHFGETILFNIPGNIPLLSGAITLEAMVYGTTNGLVLSGFFAGFLVVNQALPVRALLRLVPRAYYPVAVVISVAVTYIPATQRQLIQIREAQAIRGYRPSGLRGWLPLLMPLLVGGLERALALSEAMTARGFASTPQVPEGNHQGVLILLGTLLLPAGWIMSMVNSDLDLLAATVGIAGAGLLIYGLWSAGRRTPHTVYEQVAWKRADWVVLIGSLLVLCAYLLPGSTASGLDYSPYPELSFPHFDPLVGITTLGMLVPALIDRNRQREHH